MTGITGITAQRRWRASVAAAVVVASSFFLGGLAGSANAGERDWDRREYQHRDYGHRDWDRGYYRAPPVVYDRPYYAPPVVYGPAWGLNFNFR